MNVQPSASSLRVLLALAATFAAACGASAAPVVVTPFTAEHEPVFENGLDMVRDPEGLGGAWLTAWEEETDRRVSLADAVALVTVRTFRTDVDLDRRETYRIIAHVDEEYLGELDDEITMTVREGEAGYGTVQGADDHILDRQFIAFIKWQQADDGAVRARWHLSPASDVVARRVRDLLLRRRQVGAQDGGRRTVIIRRN